MERLRSDYRGKFVVFSDWFVKRSGTDQSLDATKRVSSPFLKARSEAERLEESRC